VDRNTITAERLLAVYTQRLAMNDAGVTVWRDDVRTAVERLVEKLRAIAPGEAVRIVEDSTGEPCFRFVMVATGEVLGRIGQAAGPGLN